MALCVPQVMILDHSFVRRLRGNLENHFDDRAKSNFDLEDVKVRLFGVGGRTFKKIKQFDEANVSHFAPDDGMFFYGIYMDRHVICFGDMCSLPSHPCHSSSISLCCDVLLHCLIYGLYHAVHGILTKLGVWYYIVFPTRGCWKVFFMEL